MRCSAEAPRALALALTNIRHSMSSKVLLGRQQPARKGTSTAFHHSSCCGAHCGRHLVDLRIRPDIDNMQVAPWEELGEWKVEEPEGQYQE